ncbi:MAG: DUF3486 family protein [Terracidiphilus sp.]|nr:DUF3486 family protein [Terracidiphilus sp.]
MAKPRPKTGEPRKTKQPLKIDLLPEDARQAIQFLYDNGRTWMEIEQQSQLPYSAKWKDDRGGFIDWESLDLSILEQFPEMKLPKSNLQRWFDLRIRQARAQVLAESARAREWAQAFAGANLPDANAAVINALRDLVFGVLQNVGQLDKARMMEELKDLTLAMSRMQRTEILERRVAIDEKAIQMKLDQVKKKADNLIGDIEGREGKPPVQLTREELLEKVRDIYGAV